MHSPKNEERECQFMADSQKGAFFLCWRPPLLSIFTVYSMAAYWNRERTTMDCTNWMAISTTMGDKSNPLI